MSRGVDEALPGAIRPLWCLSAASFILAVTAACGGSTPASRQSAEPVTPSAPSVANPADPQAQAAYLGMWRAFVAASATADYQSPSLAHYAVGGALSVLTHGLYANYQNGIVTRGQPSFHPAVTITSPSSGPAQAEVTDCADSSHVTDFYRSGKAVSESPQGRRRIIAQLQLFDGVWKVTYLNVGRAGTC